MTESTRDGGAPGSGMLGRWVGWASPGGQKAKLLIVKYHRAGPRRGPRRGRRAVGSFEAHAPLLQRTFNTLTVADACRRIKDGTLPPRALCITFDDGYADNYNVGLPILERHGLVATFFVPSGLLGQTSMWSDQIANVFATAGDKIGEVRNYLSDAGMPIRYPDLMNKLKYMSTEAQETIVRGLSAFGEIDSDSSRLMSAEEIRGLVQRGMEVGGHTVNHTILANVDDNQALREISQCKSDLEAITDRPVVSFAYPNGRRDADYTQRDVDIVRKAGFDTAVNTEFGLAGSNKQLYEMPRVPQYFVTPMRLFRLFL